MEQKNFVLTVENINSPVIVTVPHGGMRMSYGSWLNNFFISRDANNFGNYVENEKVVIGGDGPVLHIACDILRYYKVNIVAGLLPRLFVDYNRFVTQVAYSDPNIKPFYDYYHFSIEKIIERLLKVHKKILLIDLHGFGGQSKDWNMFDLIVGTNDGETTPNNYDKLFYNYFSMEYNIFVSEVNNPFKEVDLYRGDTTNLFYYKKYGIDGMLLEVSRRFRFGECAKQQGQTLSKNLAMFFKSLN